MGGGGQLEKDGTITFKCKTYKVNYLYDFFEKYTKSKEFKKDYVKAKFKKTTGCGFAYINYSNIENLKKLFENVIFKVMDGSFNYEDINMMTHYYVTHNYKIT